MPSFYWVFICVQSWYDRHFFFHLETLGSPIASPQSGGARTAQLPYNAICSSQANFSNGRKTQAQAHALILFRGIIYKACRVILLTRSRDQIQLTFVIPAFNRLGLPILSLHVLFCSVWLICTTVIWTNMPKARCRPTCPLCSSFTSCLVTPHATEISGSNCYRRRKWTHVLLLTNIYAVDGEYSRDRTRTRLSWLWIALTTTTHFACGHFVVTEPTEFSAWSTMSP